jgi:hypothetical protein
MAYGDRKSQRVAFSRAIDATVISIDGTFKRACLVVDISHSGARVALNDDSGFDLTEFFLLMSSQGAVHRRCCVVRRYGNEIGVTFIRSDPKR